MINRRAQLTDAAENAFARLGYANATMADIAKAAGVTRPTVYAYFDSKHDALHAVAARVQQDFLALQEQSGTDTADTLRLTLTAYLRECVRHYGILTVINHQALSDPEFERWLDEIHTRTNKRHAKYLRVLAEAGEVDLVLPASTLVEIVTGITLRFAQLTVSEPEREAEFAEQLVATHLTLVGLAASVTG